MYCTLADIEAEMTAATLAQATDDTAGKVIIAAIVQEKIAESSADIDDYLRERYALPVSSTETETLRTLKAFCITLTTFKLYDRRLRTKMPEALIKARDMVMRELEKIQNGKRTLSAQGAGKDGKRPSFFRSNGSRRCEEFSQELLSQY